MILFTPLDYVGHFKRMDIGTNPNYPINDIGLSYLFYEITHRCFRYVLEPKCFYYYNGTRWVKDQQNLQTLEQTKFFALGLSYYGQELRDKDIENLGNSLNRLAKRESLIRDVATIDPLPFSTFDQNPYYFNCTNMTYDLKNMEFIPQSPQDFITKVANVRYDKTARCERWEEFIAQIMEGDVACMEFLQKTFGYALSGATSEECFFIFYGSTTRNGKSTCCETIAHLMGEYACHIQPETLARGKKNGSTASPDVARLQGVRLAVTPEPEKGLELNASLIKQLTGGDKMTSRFLNENPIEFTPQFKLVMNTNHQPRISDDTVFSSQRVKLVPFERHFREEEQDKGLKSLFRTEEAMSGILNWMLEGYSRMEYEGFVQTGKLGQAVKLYQQESDVFGTFLRDVVIEDSDRRTPTSQLYLRYKSWNLENGYHSMNSKNFVGELRKRYEIKRNGKRGNEIVGVYINE